MGDVTIRQARRRKFAWAFTMLNCDGDRIPSNKRPAVNPWRHIATRQKHFKHAEDKHWLWNWRFACKARQAFQACRWGTP